MSKYKLLRNTQLDGKFKKEGDIVEIPAEKGKVLCDCGVCKEIKAPKPKKEGK